MSFKSLNQNSSDSDDNEHLTSYDVEVLMNKIQGLTDQISKLNNKLDNLSSKVDKIDRNMQVKFEYLGHNPPSLVDNIKKISNKVDEMYQKSRPRDTSKVMMARTY